MLKYINNQLLQDQQLQQQLEAQFSVSIQQRLRHNLRAFKQYQPELIPLLNSASQQYFIFCTQAEQLNITDCTTGRVLYSEQPLQETLAETQRFWQSAPYISVNEQTTSSVNGIVTEPLPLKVDTLMVFGLGLGHHIVELIQNVRVKYLIIYEPIIDFLRCSIQSADWEQIFELADEFGTLISFQLGNSGTTVSADLAELLSLSGDMQKVYLYRHICHPVSDEVFEFLINNSGKPEKLLKQGRQFLGFNQPCDFLTERPYHVLANEPFSVEYSPQQQKCFSQNMQVIRQLYPDVYQSFIDYKPQCWQLINQQNGQINLQHQRRRAAFYHDVENESRLFIEQFQQQPTKDNILVNQTVTWKFRHYVHYQAIGKLRSVLADVKHQTQKLPAEVNSLIIFGVILGRHLELLLQKSDVTNLYLCEPNTDFFYASLYTTDWAKILTTAEKRGHRIYLNIGGTGQEYFSDFAEQFYHSGAYAIADTYMMSSYYTPELSQAVRMLRSQLRIILAMGEYFDHTRYGIAHTAHNLQTNQYFLKALNGVLSHHAQDVPVFIIGNGPSLDSCIQQIQEHRGKSIIISCGTALKSLYNLGIQPDIHAEIEQNRSTFNWITQIPDRAYLKQIKLLSISAVHPDTVALFSHAYLIFKEGEASSVLFQSELKQAGFDTETLEFAYPTVSNLAVNFALKIGFKQVYLFGIDLGYLDITKHHSQHSSYYNAEGKELYDYKKVHGDGIPALGNFQDIVFTKPEFDVSRRLIEQAISEHRQQTDVYNCSNGVRIDGAIPLSPDNILIQTLAEVPSRLIDDMFNTLFFRVNNASLSQSILQRYDLALLNSTIEHWCKLIDTAITTPEEARKIISQQWLHLRSSAQQKGNLTMLLFNGSAMYFLSVLTKLIPQHNNDDELQRFNKTLVIWHDYLKQAIETYSAEPLQLDEVTVSIG